MARELSDIVVYTKARKLKWGRAIVGSGVYNEMYSIGEKKSDLLAKAAPEDYRAYGCHRGAGGGARRTGRADGTD